MRAATAAVPLHPSLQKLDALHRRRLRLLGALLLLTILGTLLFEVVIAFTSQDGASLLLLGLIVLLMLPIVAGVGGLLWVLNRWLSRSLNAASQLLRDCAPQAARLTPIERASRDRRTGDCMSAGGPACGAGSCADQSLLPLESAAALGHRGSAVLPESRARQRTGCASTRLRSPAGQGGGSNRV